MSEDSDDINEREQQLLDFCDDECRKWERFSAVMVVVSLISGLVIGYLGAHR